MIFRIVLAITAIVCCTASAVFAFLNGKTGWGIGLCALVVINGVILVSYFA